MTRQDWRGKESRLYRSDDAVILGVCGGIAETLDLSPWGVRLVVVVMSVFFFWATVPAYFILGLVLKKREVPEMDRDLFHGWDGPLPHGAVLGRLRGRFDELDRRLQRLETEVTRPGFAFEDRLRG
jgi:phage shock protein C